MVSENKLRPPHLLIAASNTIRMIKNVSHVLDPTAIGVLEGELDRQCKMLYQLGMSHYRFARKVPAFHWRQRISRLYYGAYNAKRAVQLKYSGVFKMDVSDHKSVSDLPDSFPHRSRYEVRLKVLREDRNLADYNHEARASDLAHKARDTEEMVDEFLKDVKFFLTVRGLSI